MQVVGFLLILKKLVQRQAQFQLTQLKLDCISQTLTTLNRSSLASSSNAESAACESFSG